jgi:hypothetical protein
MVSPYLERRRRTINEAIGDIERKRSAAERTPPDGLGETLRWQERGADVSPRDPEPTTDDEGPIQSDQGSGRRVTPMPTTP